MNIFNKAAKVCRSASRSLLAPTRALSRLTPDRFLEIAARVLCVESRGVMVCGSAGASVAHFPSPQFSSQHTSL
ncbi:MULTISPECIES: hypothetical protein [unclassified Pseudomonas]|uniref:hypothetical protein n=1 Tax=unclassified Pseudomonas TaxID=196821 RepID=UPI00384DE32C